MKEEEVIQGYIDYLSKQKMYSNHTVSAYLNDINIFNKYVTNEDYSLFAVDTTVIRNFLENQLLDGISKRSLKRRLVSLHGFYSFMKEKNVARLLLEVRESNEPAKNLYIKNGFSPIAVRKNYYTN